MALFPLLSLLCPFVVINSNHEYNFVLSHVSLTCRTTGGSVVTRHIRSGICWNNPDSLKHGESTVREVEEEGRGDDDWVIWGMKGDWTACCDVKSWLWWKWVIQLQEGQLTEYTSCQWPCWPSERTIQVQPKWHLRFLLSSGQEVKRPSSSQKWTVGEGKKLEDYTALGRKKKKTVPRAEAKVQTKRRARGCPVFLQSGMQGWPSAGMWELGSGQHSHHPDSSGSSALLC